MLCDHQTKNPPRLGLDPKLLASIMGSATGRWDWWLELSDSRGKCLSGAGVLTLTILVLE